MLPFLRGARRVLARSFQLIARFNPRGSRPSQSFGISERLRVSIQAPEIKGTVIFNFNCRLSRFNLHSHIKSKATSEKSTQPLTRMMSPAGGGDAKRRGSREYQRHCELVLKQFSRLMLHNAPRHNISVIICAVTPRCNWKLARV